MTQSPQSSTKKENQSSIGWNPQAEPEVNWDLASSFGLSREEWEHAHSVLERSPSYAELGVISVMWSEHCSYKSSRVHLSRLPTEGPQVVQGPGENAGAVDIGDGYCAVFKMESHNHPSFIEPYQGAATGVGGILRDVFTMGARPVASLNSLRFGHPEHPKTERLLRGVVAGIAGYGNCIGVPTVGGEVQFDRSYDGNILVNAMTVGIAKTDELFFGRAEGLGNPVIYVGARTGRDGIHGATMASAEFEGGDSEAKLPTVQVGDPFTEKLLLEACLEIFKSGCLEGVQDMGAAGLTSSSVEMAARAGTGLELDLDRIPRRAYNLSPYEMLLSESQERMLMVAKAGREQEVFDICKKWDLDASVVGTVTDTERFVCRATPHFDPLHDKETSTATSRVVVDLPIGLLTDDAPKYDRPQKEPSSGKNKASGKNPQATLAAKDTKAALLRLLRSPNVGSRAFIWEQYDHIVGASTVAKPGESDAAVIRAFCGDGPDAKEKMIALAVDGNGRHVDVDPYLGAQMIVAECSRNVACTGAKPLGLTDCLNFGNPENPETMWTIARAIDGMAEACRVLDVPVVSGNVSLYNETAGRSVLPTPSVAVVGQLASPDDRLTAGFSAEQHHVALLGPLGEGALAGSEWLSGADHRSAPDARVPHLDLQLEKRLQGLLLTFAKQHLLSSCHDLSEGGLGVALAESCILGKIGATVSLPKALHHLSLEAQFFAEDPSRVLVSYAPDLRDTVSSMCDQAEIPFTELGHTGGSSLEIAGFFSVSVDELATNHGAALSAVVSA